MYKVNWVSICVKYTGMVNLRKGRAQYYADIMLAYFKIFPRLMFYNSAVDVVNQEYSST